MTTLLQDLRYGVRLLFKHKGFSAVAILSLALGIGANTAMFSVVDAVLMKMLPVEEPDHLVLFRSVSPREFSPGGYNGGNAFTDPATGQLTLRSFPYLSYQRIQEQQAAAGVLSDVFAFGNIGLYVKADGRNEPASGQAVSGNYYTGLGVQAMLGRTLIDTDNRAEASPVAVLSYRYWQQRFSGDPSIIGKQINLNNVAFTIVGVTPPRFEGTMNVGTTLDVTIPIVWEPQLATEKSRSRINNSEWWLRIMGRLKPGVTAEQARGQLEPVFHQSVLEHRAIRQAKAIASGGNTISDLDPKHFPRLFLDPGGQGEMYTRQRYAPSLYLLLGVVGSVLLIACANVANLLLSRAASRQKEIALRLAIGASRFRLIRQLLTESLLLSVVGGTVGVIFAFWIKNGLPSVEEWGGGAMRGLDPKLDWRVLLFTLGLSLMTGILFGLIPAWRSAKLDLTPTLKDTGRSSSAGSRSLLSRGLVVLQVALSLLLLIGAGLFVQTLVNLQRADPGFNTHNLLIFGVQSGRAGYREERLEQIYQQLAERFEAIPGVRAVTFSSMTLLAENWSSRGFFLRSALSAPPDSEGRIKPTDSIYINQVRENFLDVMQISLLAGRSLKVTDDARAPRVAVVNQTFANRYFPNENPVGKRFAFDPKKPDEVEIIGLVKDTKYARQRDETPPTAYLSWRQELRGMESATFEVRTAADPLTIVNAVRQAVLEIDANLPLNNLRTQVEQSNQTFAMERLFAKLMTLFGILAQLLAAIGLFGVLAYAVSQRTREIGIRIALGATQHDVLMMIVRQGITLALLGVGAGAISAYLLTRYLENWMQFSKMLYGIKPTDPMTYLSYCVADDCCVDCLLYSG